MKQSPDLDLGHVTIVNETRSEDLPGDVTVYRTLGEACRSLEAWWVRDKEGVALTANGDRLVFAPTEPVTVLARERHPDGERLVYLWLHAHAVAVQRARNDGASLPTGIADLIRYVGFDR